MLNNSDNSLTSSARAMPIAIPALNLDLINNHTRNRHYSHSAQPRLQQHHRRHPHDDDDPIRVAPSTSADMFFKRNPREKDLHSAGPSTTDTSTSNTTAAVSTSTARHLFSTPNFFKRNASSESVASKPSREDLRSTTTTTSTSTTTTAAHGHAIEATSPNPAASATLLAEPEPQTIAPSPLSVTLASSPGTRTTHLSDDSNHLRIPSDVLVELGELFSNIDRDVVLGDVSPVQQQHQRRSPSPSPLSLPSPASSPSISVPRRNTPSPRPQLTPIITNPRPQISTSSPAFFPKSRSSIVVIPPPLPRNPTAAVDPTTAALGGSTDAGTDTDSSSILALAPVPSLSDPLNILSPPPNTASLHQRRLIDALSAAFDKIAQEPSEEISRSPRSPRNPPRTPRTPRTPSSPHPSSPSSPRFLHKRSTSATGLNSQYTAGDRMYTNKRNSSGINLASVISAVEQQQQRGGTTTSAVPAAVASFVTPHTNLPHPRLGILRQNLSNNGSTSSLSSTSSSNSPVPASPVTRTPIVDTFGSAHRGSPSIFDIPEDDKDEYPSAPEIIEPAATFGGSHSSPSTSSFPPKPFGSTSTSVVGKIVKRPSLKPSFSDVHAPLHSKPVSLAVKKATSVTPAEMADMLRSGKSTSNGKKKNPLLIDVRNLAEYQQNHIHGSFNVNLPTLLIKRYRRGNISNFSLESFITTPEGREAYLERLRGGGRVTHDESGDTIMETEVKEDGTVDESMAEEGPDVVVDDDDGEGDDGEDDEEVIVVYDETMDELDKNSPAWTLVGVLERAVSGNLGATTAEGDSNEMTPHTATRVYWMKGGFNGFMKWDGSSELVGGDVGGRGTNEFSRSGTELHPGAPGQPAVISSVANSNAGGSKRTSLFSLDTTSTRTKRDSSMLSKQASLRAAGRSQARRPARPAAASDEPSVNLAAAPSFNHTVATGNNTLNAATSVDRVPNTPTSAIGTGDSNSGSTLSRSSTVSHSSAAFSNLGSGSTNTPISPAQSGLSPPPAASGTSASLIPEEQPATPATPMTDASSSDDSPRLSGGEEAFSISEIIPGFLFVGPELTTDEHVSALEERGIRRVLNMAEECQDDVPGLKEKFVYKKIAARDTVEMRNVERCLREAVEFIDDSKHNHDPIYVHCKAGKSRSVTAILAYLISVEKWRLKRAYRHVTKMRPGICPNIGFVAELMRIEDGVHGSVSNFVGPDWNEGSMPSPELTREIERLEREWEKDSNGSEAGEDEEGEKMEIEGEHGDEGLASRA